MRYRIILFLLGFVMAMAYALSPLFGQPTMAKTVTVTVHSGDTLWRICERVGRQYKDPRDIREIIYYTRKHNELESRILLQAGQKIVVPLTVPQGGEQGGRS